MRYYKCQINKRKISVTLAAILFYVYRKQDLALPSGYKIEVINRLITKGLLKRIDSQQKGTFFFLTEKAKGLKAIDLAKEYLWNFHNVELKKEINGKKYIFCFDDSLPNGKGLIEIGEAIDKCFV